MKIRFLVTLLFLAAALPRAIADEWSSDKYLCALTIPTQESWTAGLKQPLPAGEVILHAVSMQFGEGIAVTFVPDMPSTDLRDPEIEKRVQEVLIVQGWELASGIEISWQGRPFLQFVGRRKDAVSGPMVGVARATIRAGDLFVVTAYGKGDVNRADDQKFLRIMNTFHFLDRPTPVVEKMDMVARRMNQAALVGSAGAAGLLVLAFAVTMFRSRHGVDGP